MVIRLTQEVSLLSATESSRQVQRQPPGRRQRAMEIVLGVDRPETWFEANLLCFLETSLSEDGGGWVMVLCEPHIV